MKVTVTQENLNKALSIVSRVVGSRTSLPVLGNVLLQTEAGRLRLSATDLEIGLTTWLGAKVDEEGAITVPSRAFAELVSSTTDSTLTLQTAEAVLKVSSEHVKVNLRGIDAEEFPVIPSIDHSSSSEVSGPALLQALKQVIIAAAPDDARPTLAGVYFKWQGTELRCVATDSYRLAEKKITLDQAVAETKEAIVPARSINELARVLSSLNPDRLAISLRDNQALFSFPDVELVSRLIDGKYPDYEKIIPAQKATSATIEAEDLRNTLRSAGIFARESANTAKLHFGPGNEITISAIASQLGDTTLSAQAEIEGEEAEANFNVKYLADGAGVISDQKIEFLLSGKLQPGLLQGVGSPDFRYVIMPLKTE